MASWILILGRNFGVAQHYYAKFGTVMENRQPKGSQCSKIRFSKIQDCGRPPSWISIFSHNFGVDERICAKFGTVMENQQLKGSQCSEIRFLKIQDGGRPPSWISILGHNIGVDQHFLHQFLHRDRKSAAQGVQVLKNQIFENSRWRTAAILDFDFRP